MVKFRSWNINKKVFSYFKNGEYYLDKDCKNINLPIHFDFIPFYWQNADQGTIIHAIIDIECFENDRLELEVCCDAWIDPSESILITGTLKRDEKGFYFEEDDIDNMGKTRLCHMTIIDGEVIGNIYE